MSVNEQRIKIIAGADVSPVIRLKNPKTKDPIDLTAATKVQFVFPKRDRTQLVVDDTQIPATQAMIDVTEGTDIVTFLATTAGALGNDIILVFNGVDDIDTIVNAWNVANPTNQVGFSSDTLTGTDILSAQTIRLTDGYDAYTPVSIEGDPLLGKVKVTLLESETQLLKRGPNHSIQVIIDYGTFPGGTRVKGFFDKLDVIDNDV
jgi:hypothetical protein